MPFSKGKDGKDGQNGGIFNNFSLLFHNEKLYIPDWIKNRNFFFDTGKDGRDGINGDVAIYLVKLKWNYS